MENHYEVAVIGAGINGLAVAREAALNGLKVILIEQEDIGSGASTKTSKLAHGGVRYLEQGDLPVVISSIKARRFLLENAPHLVRPLPFLYPAYKQVTRPFWQIRLGLFLYDKIDWRGKLRGSSSRSYQEVNLLYPGLIADGFSGCCEYYDAQMDDCRLNAAALTAALQAGAVVLTRTKLLGLQLKEGCCELHLTDTLNQETKSVFAKHVVNATGASEPVPLPGLPPAAYQLYPSKGIHLVIDQMCSTHALLLHAPQDGRVFFIIPWKGKTLLGATETSFSGDPLQAKVMQEDRQYLLDALKHYFPDWQGSVINEFAGVRPLAGYASDSLGRISRSHILSRHESFISILGGKYTTFQQVAEEVMKWLKPASSAHREIVGGDCQALLQLSNEQLEALGKEIKLSAVQIRRLITTYGSDWPKIKQIILENPTEGRQVCPEHPELYAELTYSILHEKVLLPEDWIYRRTSIGLATSCGGRRCFEHIRNHIELKAKVKGKE